LKFRRNPFQCLPDLFSLGLNGSHRSLLQLLSRVRVERVFALILRYPAIKIVCNLICVLNKIEKGQHCLFGRAE
jgi:hypothetical protein